MKLSRAFVNRGVAHRTRCCLQPQRRLGPGDFFDPLYRDIYAAILRLAEKGIAVDFNTVTNERKATLDKFSRKRHLFSPQFLSDIEQLFVTSCRGVAPVK